MEFFLTAANLLYVFAYFVRSTLRLRVLSLGGTSCLIVYFLTLPEPLMRVVYWNALYAVINMVWIGRILAGLADDGGEAGASRPSGS